MRPLRVTASRYFQRRHAALASALPSPLLAGFSEEQTRFAARGWTMRAEQEHHSAAIFADLVSFLVDVGVPLDLLARINGIVSDELRHAELCVEMSRRMNGPSPRARELPRGMPPQGPSQRRARGLHVVLVEGAIGETISSRLFNAGRHVAEEPCTKKALTLIHRDETQHARVFWETLRALSPELAAGDLERLHHQARSALASLEQEQMSPALQRLERGDAFDPAWGALGVLPPERRVEAFYWAIEKRVIPHLDDLGLDGASAWTQRYRSSSPASARP